MEEIENEYYLKGIMNIASSISKNIGLSYIDVEVYNKERFKEEFCEYHRINIKELELNQRQNELKEALKEWFLDDKKIIESIIYWINNKLGKEKQIYKTTNKIIDLLCSNNKGNTIFYTVEDVMFIEYEKEIIVFILGNNE